MFPVISLSIIAVAVVVILFIIVKKFPALAILDATNVPGEKEAKFKEQIIKARVERNLERWSGFFGRIWLFLSKRLAAELKSRQENLKKIKARYRFNNKMSVLERQRKIKELLSDARERLDKEEEAAAEEKLLAVVGLDQKNLGAFFSLGELYESQKKLSEASQTFNYALRLARQRQVAGEENGAVSAQEIHFALAGVEKEAGNMELALEHIREALELEPNQPRYLDLILDLSIIRKDKDLANECWEKLVAVNPENNKLAELKEEIDKL